MDAERAELVLFMFSGGTAAGQAAIEFAKAAAMRPRIVGEALQQIGQDPEVSASLFSILEVQNLLTGNAKITLIPKNNELLGALVAGRAEQSNQ